jgi:hypothetical protein
MAYSFYTAPELQQEIAHVKDRIISLGGEPVELTEDEEPEHHRTQRHDSVHATDDLASDNEHYNVGKAATIAKLKAQHEELTARLREQGVGVEVVYIEPVIAEQVVEPVPTVDEPVPTVDEPVPTVDEPVPTVDKPVPTVDKPIPVMDKPMPEVSVPDAGEYGGWAREDLEAEIQRAVAKLIDLGAEGPGSARGKVKKRRKVTPGSDLAYGNRKAKKKGNGRKRR